MGSSISLTKAELRFLRVELGNACMRAGDRVENARDAQVQSEVGDALREKELVDGLYGKVDRACG